MPTIINNQNTKVMENIIRVINEIEGMWNNNLNQIDFYEDFEAWFDMNREEDEEFKNLVKDIAPLVNELSAFLAHRIEEKENQMIEMNDLLQESK